MKRRGLLFVLTVLWVFTPFLPLMLWSVSGRWFYPSILPQELSLRAWSYISGTAASQIMEGLVSSFSLASVTTILSLLIGIPAARALGLYQFRGKRLLALFLLMPLIVPPLSVSMGLHHWFLRLGLAETFAGLVLIHLTFCLPYTISVLWGVFSDYSVEFEEQARSLGANQFSVIHRVMIPMILPGINIAILFSFLVSWSQYLSSLIIGGGKILTLPILLFSLMDSGDRPVAAAVSLLFVAPALLILLLSSRSLSRNSLQGLHQ